MSKPDTVPGDSRTTSQNLLRTLIEVSNELSMAESFDDLCRQVIELGRSRLGFDRLGIWFTAESGRMSYGAFGTDEQGRLRDERGQRIPLELETQEILARENPTAPIRKDGPLRNHMGETVGQGTRIWTPIWDGRRIIGHLTTDNFLKGEPFRDDQLELLSLYASTLGHLSTRKRAEDALRESDEAERRYQERLRTLLEVSHELSTYDSLEPMCKRAVELALSRLDFDRAGIWFLTGDGTQISGMFGTDEQGNVRDERHERLSINRMTSKVLERNKPTITRRYENQPLHDNCGRRVGIGSASWTTIWDGQKIIGWLCVDNLLTKRRITDRDAELHSLFASTLGHLCARLRAEELHLDRVRKLTADAERSLEAERARISKELHDELGQQLTALNLNLAWIENRVPTEDDRIRERFTEAKASVNEILRSARHMSKTLRPPLLDHHGLADALRSYVSEFEQRAGIACRVVCTPSDLEVGDPPATVAFRIVQEALTNVARHSEASECEVRLLCDEASLHVTIKDNGRGAGATELAEGQSLGIIGMRERATAVGGTLRIISEVEGAGVLVDARLPLPSGYGQHDQDTHR